MARRTKEDAAETRSRLLDAAELLFHEKGVSRTSLNDIALAAGATRGAIYWHFENKGDLLTALWERVALPMQQAFDEVAQQQALDILGAPYTLYQAGFDASWELDLWGRVRRSVEAAEADDAAAAAVAVATAATSVAPWK